jgi:hypothetical protein
LLSPTVSLTNVENVNDTINKKLNGKWFLGVPTKILTVTF